jgi:hypothetical protein
MPRHVGVAARVHGDAHAFVNRIAAQEGGINQADASFGAVPCIVCPECGAVAETIMPPDSTPAFEPGSEAVTWMPKDLTAASAADVGCIAGYEILGELGRGGMGVVYTARQVGLQRVVALKMILPQARLSLEQLERFRREAEAAARLQHPHIVQIHEIGAQVDRPYFSLEFVEGGSLDKKLAGTPQPPRTAAALLETLARAMHYAHERGVVHRDLKPANVLLTVDGVPKIGDFGLAKQLDAEMDHTQSGAILGTASYMAPEQALGQKQKIGPLSDVYALGAILYEMLTGRPPFRGTTLLETLEQVRSEEPVPPKRLQPGVLRDLETICLKCLHKEPGKRYPSALALAEDPRRFSNGEPIQARPVGAPERLWRWCRRKPALAGLVLVAITAFITVTGLWLLAERNGIRAERNAQNEEKQRQRAEENLRAAQQALEDNLRVSFEFLQRKEPGTFELRKKLLESASKALATLHAQHRGDRKLRASVAVGHSFLGHITREIGSPEEALAGFRKAQNLWEGLLAEDLSETERRKFQRALASCYKTRAESKAKPWAATPRHSTWSGTP